MTKDEIKALMFTRVRGFGCSTEDVYDGELIGYNHIPTPRYQLLMEDGKTRGCKTIEPLPEPKRRLMTPAELAGGWIVFDGETRDQIVGFNNIEGKVYTRATWFYVSEIAMLDHSIIGWSRTAQGEIESIEVDDE